MHNSQKNPILQPRKQPNTQTPKKPHSSQSPYPGHQSHTNPDSSSLSLNINKNLSFQNSLVGTGVSYSQLQIILQNVQQVKKKANQQMQVLEKRNGKLEEEVRSMREQLRRYEDLEETIREEKNGVERKYQLEMQHLRTTITQLQQTCNILTQNLTQQCQQTHQKSQQLTQQTHLTQSTKTTLLTLQQKYNKLTQLLKINQQSNEARIIREQYQDVPHLLELVVEMRTRLGIYQGEVEELKGVNQELREQVGRGGVVVANVTQENRHLLAVIQELNKQKDSLTAQLQQSQSQTQTLLSQTQQTQTQTESKLQTLHTQTLHLLSQKQSQIQTLHSQLSQLQQTISQYQCKQRTWKQENQFKLAVEEVCDQFADYQHVVKRVEYLEKYRSQYYFNIQKIQFLCKILDA